MDVADPCEYFLWPWYRLWEFYKQKCVVCFIMCLYIYIYIYIQVVPGGMCQTSGECSLC